jgi:DNA-binding LacI/PurR family transcriptional regulator
MALAVIAALNEAGREVPRECAVSGYDNSPSATYYSPSLTAVGQDAQLAAAVLVEKIMQFLDGSKPLSVLLPTELVARNT